MKRLKIPFREDTMRNYDICILGAGFAGLYCAIECAKKWPNASIVILEKYNYVGGRAITFHRNIPGHGSFQWENGAGRIHSSHKWVVDLVDKYGLTKIPIEGGLEMRVPGKSDPITVDFEKYIKSLNVAALSKEVLLENTLDSILTSVAGPEEARNLMNTYEYRSEVDTLRADRALEALNGELGHGKGFFVIKEGFSYLVEKLQNEAEKLGVTILKKHSATNLEKLESEGGSYKVFVKDHIPIKAGKVVVAIPRDAVAELPCFKNLPLLQKVKMRPLVRMYAIFPKSANGGSWFQDLKKFVCDFPIRYVIPVNPNTGVIMISYTDGPEAEYWIRMQTEKGDAWVQAEVMKQIRMVLSHLEIPDPFFFKIHPWSDGCSYWVPGSYDFLQESLKSVKPLPKQLPGVYMCNESWAYAQCWVKCAIDQADLCFKKMVEDSEAQ